METEVGLVGCYKADGDGRHGGVENLDRQTIAGYILVETRNIETIVKAALEHLLDYPPHIVTYQPDLL